MRIEFQKYRYEYDDSVKKSIELCEKYGGYLQIDKDFCVYAFYNGSEHWVGYARPYDIEWFNKRFSGMTINDLNNYLEQLIAAGYGNYRVVNTGYMNNILKEDITIDKKDMRINL